LSTTLPMAVLRRPHRHRWAIRTTASVSHKSTPTPDSASKPTSATAQPRYFVAATTEAAASATKARHDVVRARTNSAMHAARGVGRVPPCPTGPGTRDGGGTAKARHRECILFVILIAVRVVVRACRSGLGASRAKDGRRIAGTLARPEAGCVVIRSRNEKVAERVECQGPDI
jgi:hypothetical protein